MTSTSMQEDAPSREDFADFALVLKDGRELKCHKILLAKVSPVFAAMLKQDCVESQTNKMQVKEFEPATVESFLDWIYAALELAPGIFPGQYEHGKYKKKFSETRLTPELLRMSHMYQVESLQQECIQSLIPRGVKKDENVVEIWSTAEMIGSASKDENVADMWSTAAMLGRLRRGALRYLKENLHRLLLIPGMKESFQSPQLMESLATYLSRMAEVITVRVECRGEKGFVTLQEVQVRRGDTIEDLRHLTDDSLEKAFGKDKYRCEPMRVDEGVDSTYSWWWHKKTKGNFSPLDKEWELDFFDLKETSIIQCDIRHCNEYEYE